MVISEATPAKESPFRGEAEVNAKRLTVDHENQRAEFKGNVRAVYGGLILKCDRMVITYGKNGHVKTLTAAGRVVVTREDARATAETAVLRAKEGVLVLEGDPVLVKGAHRLEGTRIRVFLKSGQLEVEEAKGTFRFDGENAR
jgi:lipopolysaccharide transport protein LptA